MVRVSKSNKTGWDQIQDCTKLLMKLQLQWSLWYYDEIVKIAKMEKQKKMLKLYVIEIRKWKIYMKKLTRQFYKWWKTVINEQN
jgi:hypothetical protein